MAGNTCCHIGSSYIIYGHVFKGSMHIYNSGGAASSQPNRMWGAAPARSLSSLHSSGNSIPMGAVQRRSKNWRH